MTFRAMRSMESMVGRYPVGQKVGWTMRGSTASSSKGDERRGSKPFCRPIGPLRAMHDLPSCEHDESPDAARRAHESRRGTRRIPRTTRVAPRGSLMAGGHGARRRKSPRASHGLPIRGCCWGRRRSIGPEHARKLSPEEDVQRRRPAQAAEVRLPRLAAPSARDLFRMRVLPLVQANAARRRPRDPRPRQDASPCFSRGARRWIVRREHGHRRPWCRVAPFGLRERIAAPHARRQLAPDRLGRFRGTLEAIRARPDEGSDPKTPCSQGFQAFSLFDDARVRNWTFCTSKGERVPEAFDAVVALSSR